MAIASNAIWMTRCGRRSICLIDEKIAAGVEPREARRRAMIELNRIEPIKEQVRDVRAGMLVDTLIQDVKYALRHMRRSPGLRRGRDPDARLRHRRQHRDVQRAQRVDDQAAADSGSRRAHSA